MKINKLICGVILICVGSFVFGVNNLNADVCLRINMIFPPEQPPNPIPEVEPGTPVTFGGGVVSLDPQHGISSVGAIIQIYKIGGSMRVAMPGVSLVNVQRHQYTNKIISATWQCAYTFDTDDVFALISATAYCERGETANTGFRRVNIVQGAKPYIIIIEPKNDPETCAFPFTVEVYSQYGLGSVELLAEVTYYNGYLNKKWTGKGGRPEPPYPGTGPSDPNRVTWDRLTLWVAPGIADNGLPTTGTAFLEGKVTDLKGNKKSANKGLRVNISGYIGGYDGYDGSESAYNPEDSGGGYIGSESTDLGDAIGTTE